MIIPTVDLASPHVAQQLADVCRGAGTCFVVNHGVPRSLIDACLDVSRQFHALRPEQKLRYAADQRRSTRGYIPADTEVDAETPADAATPEIPRLHCSFDLSFEVDAHPPSPDGRHILLQPNVWPTEKDVPKFREVVSQYYASQLELGRRIARLLCRGLGIEDDFIVRQAASPTSHLRLLFYEQELCDGRYGPAIKPHTDFEVFTLLYQNSPGLEIFWQDEWHAVDVVDDSFVFTTGDLLEGWTNGICKSILHRVPAVNSDRYSLPFFFGVDFDTEVAPLEQFGSPRYSPFLAGEHLLDFAILASRALRDMHRRGELQLTHRLPCKNDFKATKIARAESSEVRASQLVRGRKS